MLEEENKSNRTKQIQKSIMQDFLKIKKNRTSILKEHTICGPLENEPRIVNTNTYSGKTGQQRKNSGCSGTKSKSLIKEK